MTPTGQPKASGNGPTETPGQAIPARSATRPAGAGKAHAPTPQAAGKPPTRPAPRTASPQRAPPPAPAPRPKAGLGAAGAAAPAKAGSAVLKWVASHKLLASLIALGVLGPSIVLGSLILVQPVTTNPAARASPVQFENGADYTAINAAGFATLTLANGGSTATLDVKGVPGAVSVTLGDVLKVHNTDTAKSYTVTLSVTGTVNAAITSFEVLVQNGADVTQADWDAVDGNPSDAVFTIAPETTFDVSVVSIVTSGTAIGSLGSFTLQMSAAMV